MRRRSATHYLSLGWDQIPHLISTSAKTIFGGVGTTLLTVPDPVQAALQAQLPNAALAAPPAASGVSGQTARTNIENIINNNVNPLELSTQRDKASAAYRFTPNADWDIGVEYTNEHRTGVRAVGVPYGWGTAASPRPTNIVEAPQPLDDRTQNVDAKAEYVGSTFFGTRWSTNVRYSGSFYENSLKQLDIENPFCVTCSVLGGDQSRAQRPPPGPRARQQRERHNLDDRGRSAVLEEPLRQHGAVQRDAAERSLHQYRDQRSRGAPGHHPRRHSGREPERQGRHVPVEQPATPRRSPRTQAHHARPSLRRRQSDTPSLHIENWIFGDSGCASGRADASAGSARSAMHETRFRSPTPRTMPAPS